jgi:hypothetical protein
MTRPPRLINAVGLAPGGGLVFTQVDINLFENWEPHIPEPHTPEPHIPDGGIDQKDRPQRRKRKPRIRDALKSERCTVEQAASILGLPVRTVQSMAASGELPGAAKINRRWNFDPLKLRQFVRTKERETWHASQKHLPDVTGGEIPSGAVLRSVGSPKGGRLTQLIQQSRRRVAKLVKTEH